MLLSTILLAAEDMGPNPIAPENKELLWGAGTFLVFLFVMRVDRKSTRLNSSH